MRIQTVMQALAVAIDAVAEDLPMKEVSVEIAQELISLLDDEDKTLLLTVICAEGAEIVHG